MTPMDIATMVEVEVTSMPTMPNTTIPDIRRTILCQLPRVAGLRPAADAVPIPRGEVGQAQGKVTIWGRHLEEEAVAWANQDQGYILQPRTPLVSLSMPASFPWPTILTSFIQ
jgi:hypothetical protein